MEVVMKRVLIVPLVLLLVGCGRSPWQDTDKVKINGVRLDPNFKTNGMLAVAFSALDKQGKSLNRQEGSNNFDGIKVALMPVSTAAHKAGPGQIEVKIQTITGVKGTGDVPLYSGVLVDNSGSNSSTDPAWSRIDGASRAVKGFCRKPTNRVYVGLFGDPASNGFVSTKVEGANPAETSSAALTRNCANAPEIDALVNALSQVKARGASGSTPLYSSLRENIRFLQKTETEIGKSQKVILITSDGEPTDTSERTPDYADFVAKSGVTIFTLGYGPSSPVTPNGAVNPALQAGAVLVLQELAQWSNGFYMPLTQNTDLESRIDSLSESLSNGYSSLVMAVKDPARLPSQQVISGTLSIAGKTDTFSFMTP
jgi:hypothetical protein